MRRDSLVGRKRVCALPPAFSIIHFSSRAPRAPSRAPWPGARANTTHAATDVPFILKARQTPLRRGRAILFNSRSIKPTSHRLFTSCHPRFPNALNSRPNLPPRTLPRLTLHLPFLISCSAIATPMWD
jgi:hypothetical protein